MGLLEVENRLGFHCHRLDSFEEGIIGNGLRRGEFFNFKAEEIPSLKRKISLYNISASVHVPLIKPHWYPSPPTLSYLCDPDPGMRKKTIQMIALTMQQAKELGADYVVVHFPASSLDPPPQDIAWLKKVALESCEELSSLSLKWKIPIHIEGVGASPLLDPNFLNQIFKRYPLLYCFDIGHMRLASLKLGFDLYLFAQEIAPYVGSIHLWNTRGYKDYRDFGHIPVHPKQKPEEGWVDVARIFKILSSSQYIIFESPLRYPLELGGYDYREGVRWIKELIKALSR